ncbi:Hypothetical protein, putative [Bodo saltans]|uniref:Uncharacterized protein n=1 Tax=Bodo saltans TaxID=75058 RepID=A0A0S4IYX4_BODSA|nr:Hypothetical protein, putative [Bodo saltans]|eukprot:CUG12946.1 Hypothetical protein, putative [Bodo saltans]
MLRRSVFRLATPRSQPSPSSIFDINLTSVFNTGHLPRNSANEFIKQCLPTLTLLKNDVALTAWRTMNPSELKQTMRASFPNQTEESVDKAVALVFNSLNIHPQLQNVITGCEKVRQMHLRLSSNFPSASATIARKLSKKNVCEVFCSQSPFHSRTIFSFHPIT